MFDQTFLPPAWVINLKRSPERRKYITAHLHELGLPFELIEAVDGRNLTPQELAALYSAERAITYSRRELAPGEVGCCLSHLKLYRRMVDKNIDEALILEDDVIIHADFFEIIKRKTLFPKDWELILLYHGSAPISFWQRQRLYQQYQCVKFAGVAYGTLGYLIRQSAARKLLSCAYPICAPMDQLAGGGIRTGVRLYGINPPCMQQLFANDPHFTTMPDRDLFRPKPPSKAEMGKCLWFLHNVKRRLVNLCLGLKPNGFI
jgi:glycosyl transferase family 25